jgi:hypothetical protein
VKTAWRHKTYLVELAVSAWPLQLLQYRLVAERIPICSPHARIGTCGVEAVPDGEVVVVAGRLVTYVILIPLERCSEVFVADPLKQVSHGAQCIVQYDVHAATVHLSDEGPPVLNVTVVMIEKGEIQRTETITAPRHVDERRTRQIDGLRGVSRFQRVGEEALP